MTEEKRNTKERNFLTLKSLRKNWRGSEHVALLHTHSEAREEWKKNWLGGKIHRFQQGGYLITTSPNCAAFFPSHRDSLTANPMTAAAPWFSRDPTSSRVHIPFKIWASWFGAELKEFSFFSHLLPEENHSYSENCAPSWCASLPIKGCRI